MNCLMPSRKTQLSSLVPGQLRSLPSLCLLVSHLFSHLYVYPSAGCPISSPTPCPIFQSICHDLINSALFIHRPTPFLIPIPPLSHLSILSNQPSPFIPLLLHMSFTHPYISFNHLIHQCHHVTFPIIHPSLPISLRPSLFNQILLSLGTTKFQRFYSTNTRVNWVWDSAKPIPHLISHSPTHKCSNSCAHLHTLDLFTPSL